MCGSEQFEFFFIVIVLFNKKYLKNLSYNSFQFELNVAAGDQKMLRFLRTGLGRKVDKVITKCCTQTSSRAFVKLLEDVNIGQLKVDVNTITDIVA